MSAPKTNKYLIWFYHREANLVYQWVNIELLPKQTQVKAIIQENIDFLKQKDMIGKKKAVFQANSMWYTKSCGMVKWSNLRILKNDLPYKKAQGAKKTITLKQIRKRENILEDKSLKFQILI